MGISETDRAIVGCLEALVTKWEIRMRGYIVQEFVKANKRQCCSMMSRWCVGCELRRHLIVVDGREDQCIRRPRSHLGEGTCDLKQIFHVLGLGMLSSASSGLKLLI